ncbi:hypothetical protein SETIT_5G289800v2 [Setaria italica]|uniref:Uncharacterized protein n=1 Tax=Setaria italica TaxID=4555 RepID=A0A368RBM7_SETIT|nr:hypothetical protein SETIT_5G289800v2 [Setaria italica]
MPSPPPPASSWFFSGAASPRGRARAPSPDVGQAATLRRRACWLPSPAPFRPRRAAPLPASARTGGISCSGASRTGGGGVQHRRLGRQGASRWGSPDSLRARIFGRSRARIPSVDLKSFRLSAPGTATPSSSIAVAEKIPHRGTGWRPLRKRTAPGLLLLADRQRTPARASARTARCLRTAAAAAAVGEEDEADGGGKDAGADGEEVGAGGEEEEEGAEVEEEEGVAGRKASGEGRSAPAGRGGGGRRGGRGVWGRGG